jgi:HemY protein
MIRYTFIIIALVALFAILVQIILGSSGSTSIALNNWAIEMKTASFLLVLLVAFFVGYLLLAVLRYVFTLHRRIGNYRGKRKAGKAGKELVQGLVLLTEGHWSKAEKHLLKHADYCETPLINYLAAARAAHMQEAYEKRDELLKMAVEKDASADVAVSVTQAELQLDSEQTAQAQATLLRLQELSPNHPYISKLLAKVYLRQKNWEALFELLPGLLKQKIFKKEDIIKYKAAALTGLFEYYSQHNRLDDLQKAWKKLPAAIRDNAEAVAIYANALKTMGETELCAKTVVSAVNKGWDDNLVEMYGKLDHADPVAAGDIGKKWMAQKEDNPAILLTMARLNKQKKLWGKAKTYYETRLNKLPDSEAYFELAQMLENIGEKDNADICYRAGLKYCIHQEAVRLNLKPMDTPKTTPISPPTDDDVYVV